MNTTGPWHVIENYLDALLDDTTSTLATIDADGAIAVAHAMPLSATVLPSSTVITATIATPRATPLDAVQPAPAAALLSAAMPTDCDSGPSPRNAASAPEGIAIAARWLRVTVATDSYALELLRVQEVVRVAPIVAMRGTVQALLGVMNLRGRIVPVFDLGLWLGGGRVVPDERSRIVVADRNDELIGVLVSAIDDIVTLGPDLIEPPLAGRDAGGVVGIARIGPVPTVLLDAETLFG